MKPTPKATRIMNIIIIAACFIIATVMIFKNTSKSVKLSIQNQTISLTDSKEFSVSIAYTDIETLVYLDEFDKGNEVSSTVSGKFTYGTYTNDLLGSYTLCVSSKIDDYLVVLSKDGTKLVFNYESADYMKNLYSALNSYFDENNQNVSHTIGG